MKVPKKVGANLPFSEGAWQALNDAARSVKYNLDNDTVYVLHLKLQTPGIFSLYKADVPTPGLPMLDGFLSFLAFQRALAEVTQEHPDWVNDLLWQCNAALRDSGKWIKFPIPIREEKLGGRTSLYDCSIGLPVATNGEILYPAGGMFASGMGLMAFPSENTGPVDQIALRRRSEEPLYRPLALSRELDPSSGPTKSLDNRIYFANTREYVFYLRGDREGVEHLLDFAKNHDIGIGKKTSLGYGRIEKFKLDAQPTESNATLGHKLDIPGMQYIALLKNIPTHEIQRRCIREKGDHVPIQKSKNGKWVDMLQPNEWNQNERLFGVREFALHTRVETFDCYRPPYWRREGRTPVLRYGTLLVPRSQG